jgi:hypothetical protein
VLPYLAPEAGLLNLQATPIGEVLATADPQVLMATFDAGNVGCHGLQHVEVGEQPDAVRLRVITGSRPTLNICTEEIRTYATEVRLAAPLDGRPIVDAAA